MALGEPRLGMSVSVGGGGRLPAIAPPARTMISGRENPHAAPGGRGSAGRERAGGGGVTGRAKRGGTRVTCGKFGSCCGFFPALGHPRQRPQEGQAAACLPAALGRARGQRGKQRCLQTSECPWGQKWPRERCGRGQLIGKQIVWLPPRKSTWSVLFPRFVMKDKDLGEREGEL